MRHLAIAIALLAIWANGARSQDQGDINKKLNALVSLNEQLLKIDYIAFKDASDKEVLTKAKANVKEELKDPESAIFDEVKVFRKTEKIYVCGKLNAKNSFGGYTGSKWFMASPGVMGVIYEDDPAASLMIPKYCFPSESQ